MDIIYFIIAMVLILFGTVLGCMLLWKLATVIQNSIKKNKNTGYEESFDRLAHAFIQHKKDTDRRLQNIEAVIAEEEPANGSLREAGYETLEIDETISENKTTNKKRVK